MNQTMPGGEAPNPPRVLIIEDADATRTLIELVLRRYACVVEGCADGRAGLQRARNWLPDLVVLDIALPGIDGWEILAALRSDELTASLPVVVTTAHAAPEVKQRALREGAIAMIPKPFSPSEMRAAVAPVLDRGGAR
jgi:CheY-like chemotaxis protein